MARKINPNQDDENIDLGRFIQEHTYKRDKKEISLGHIKLDIIRQEKGQIVIGEVKKSSRYEQSAKMQLAFYLAELNSVGIKAVGELLFPQEKKKVTVALTESLIAEIATTKQRILEIAGSDYPPPPEKNKFCRNCAYAEFCWA